MKFHFTPPKGWTNDPNGLIRIGDEYHIFYQHYPDGIVWGPMHWGHAVSKDLLTFEHKEIAITPDELGYAFSGSSVLDVRNVSGLGTSEKPALLCFYTSHNPKTGEQQQSVAYSLDYRIFQKYGGNPVIQNTKEDPAYKVDYRDPKVFENPVKGGYTMVLAAGKKLEFQHSTDLFHWNKTGEYAPGVHGFDGICECPDCFPLSLPDGTVRWILLLSTILEEKDVGKKAAEGGFPYAHVMQYFVGTFDGDTFREDEGNPPLVLDFGPDNYAMVSFAGCTETILYGWGEHWDYVTDVPAETYRGKMTVPRLTRLADTKNGLRMAMLPPENVPQRKVTVQQGESVAVVNSKGNEVILSVEADVIVVDRSRTTGGIDSRFLQKEAYNVFRAERYTEGAVEFVLVEDEDFFEIFAENGLLVFSLMTY